MEIVIIVGSFASRGGKRPSLQIEREAQRWMDEENERNE